MRIDATSSHCKKVLITGASGFIGRHLINAYAENGWKIRAVVRSIRTCNLDKKLVIEIVEVPDIAEISDWTPLLEGCTVVAHLAARAHQTQEAPDDGEVAFSRVNVAATSSLASAASKANVQRFLFVSSSGVMGSVSEKPWTEEDIPQPHSAYTKSKLRAESEVRTIAGKSAMEYVIVRPALVYGPGNPGNLARLLGLVATGLPLPFEGVKAERSMTNVNYLARILVLASTSRAVANQTYLVSDGEDLKLSAIVRAFSDGLGVPVRLFKCPVFIMNTTFKLLGKSSEWRKLTGVFQIAPFKLQKDLNITSFSEVHESLVMTAKVFASEKQV